MGAADEVKWWPAKSCNSNGINDGKGNCSSKGIGLAPNAQSVLLSPNLLKMFVSFGFC